MPNAIQIHQTGGPEVLQWGPVVIGDPAAHQVKLKQTAIGLNFIDVYFRTGLYQGPPLPLIPGMEAAGEVIAVGEQVSGLKIGDRVAYAPVMGAYAEERLIAADRVVKLPEEISDEQAAAMMLKGMTAYYLLHQTNAVQPGQTILFHAAAGGVGLIACQWAKQLGATVIGTVGSEEKAALAKAHGCDHPIIYTRDNVVEQVKALTDGKGVPVVYDSVGQATLMDSLACLQPMGHLVSFGQSSGAIPPFDLGLLGKMGSLSITRPSLMDYTASHEQLMTCANGLFAALAAKQVTIEINQRFPLAEVAEAHRQLEARQTTGATVLLV